jgi:hypothetical protein
MPLTQKRLDQALDQLLALVQETDGVRAEFDHTLETFHASGEPGDTAHALAGRRAVEWFLLERHSPALQGVPLELALHGGVGLEHELPDEELLQALLTSFCGVFEVSDVRAGEGVWVRDLLAFGEHPLAEREGSRSLEVGDVLVGRLFPIGDGLHRISHAAGVFRNPGLAAALTADLERAREGRRGVVRLSQSELETMFWAAKTGGVTDAELITRARTVLADAGLEPADVELVFAQLAAEPFSPQPAVLGAHDPIAHVLDALAFATDVDLEVARRALFDAWPVLARPTTDTPQAPHEQLEVEQAVAKFDRGRAEGRDLELLFSDLERDLALDAGDEPADDDLAPDFPGVVGAMVEEFLWETEREQGPEATGKLRVLARLSAFGAPIGVFEEISARELLSFAAVWLPEWGDLKGADDARATLAALRAFCAWTQERHEVPLRDAYESDLVALEDSLPRVAEANRHCAPSDDVTMGDVYVVERSSGGSAVVLDATGAPHEPAIAADLAGHLRPGDHLRASLGTDGRFAVYRCYPPECAALQQRR